MKRFNEPAVEPFDVGLGPIEPDRTILEQGRVPVDAYFSPERFETEREIFGSAWLYAGREKEVAKPGDRLTVEFEIRNASVVIVNDEKQGLKAFYNACPHRGMRLIQERRTHGKRINCPFHAWSFGTDGQLKGLPDEENFQVCKQDIHLRPVHIDSWAGFMFVNLDPDPAMTLQEFLGPIGKLWDGAPLDDFCFSIGITDDVPANWKMGNDVAGEGYHVSALHPKSARDLIVSSYNPHVHWLGWKPMGAHRFVSVPSNPEFRLNPSKPIQTFVFESVPQTMIIGDNPAIEGENELHTHPDVNPLGATDWGGDAVCLFPTGAVTVMRNGWWTNCYWPVSIDTARWSARWYFRKPKTRRELFAVMCSGIQYRDVQTEDNYGVRGQMQGLATGAFDRINLGYAEIGLRHMHAVLSAAVEQRRGGHDQQPQRWAAE